MKALICKEFAPFRDHSVEEIDPPALKKGHVRVEIRAAGVNFPDILQIQGEYQFKPPFPFVPGAECSGVITEVAEDVPYLKIGHRVAGLATLGAFAEEAVIPMTNVMPIPDAMPFADGAAFAMVYGTSYYALKQRAALKPGETLLVLGAAGGVGLATVELGKAMGATVIAAASMAEKLETAKAHGADFGINYVDEDLKARAKEIGKGTDSGGIDVIYDPVGDKFAEPALRSMNWGGRYLVIGFAGGEIPKIPLNLALLKSVDIRGVFWGAWTLRDPKGHQNNMGEIMEMYKTGKIKPRVSNQYALEDFGDAFAELMERRAMGKVVLTMNGG